MILKQGQTCKVILLSFFAISAFAQAKTSDEQPAASAAVAMKGATADPNYVIGPQDVLDVSVWREPDLTRSVPVRPDGKITLPLIDDIQAAGLTPMQLASQIKTKLDNFLTKPQVTVIVTQTNSQRIYVLGEISRTGAYALIPEMTVLQAISNAGGPTPFANSKKIYVLRQTNGKQEKFFFNYKDVVSGKHTEQNITLKPGDTIVVP